MLRRFLVALAAAALALLAVVVTRAARVPRRQPPPLVAARVAVDGEAAAQRLAAAIRIPTVSLADAPPARGVFAALHRHLEASFPLTHRALTREVVGGASLLYTWRGSEPSLPPIVLAAHLDVVPVDAPERWRHPPFAGVVTGGEVWGRGAWDDKGAVLAIVEAVEALLASGFAPRRGVVLAFGHDEEVGGERGAAAMARLLARRGPAPLFVLDEGGVVGEGLVPGVAAPVALVGIAEKGYLTLELVATARGGHSSLPGGESAIGTLARALARLEEQPLPARLGDAHRQLFAFLAPEMAPGMRAVAANPWLFRPLLLRRLLSDPQGAASVRTTTALTVVRGGIKDNVLPAEARALVNFRLLPGDSARQVMAAVAARIDDPRVRVRPLPGAVEASPVSDPGSPSFAIVGGAVRAVYPGAVVAPYLVVAATDARHYARITRDVYRFVPFRARAEQLPMFHGTDERVTVEGHARAIRFYATLVAAAAG
jgi:carboxypeptidase PM20D1